MNRFLGNLDAAKKDLEEAIQWNSKGFQAAKQRAIIFCEEEQYEAAIDLLRPFSLDDKSCEAKMIMVNTLRLAKRYSEAIAVLKDCEVWNSQEEIKSHSLIIQLECYFVLQNSRYTL